MKDAAARAQVQPTHPGAPHPQLPGAPQPVKPECRPRGEAAQRRPLQPRGTLPSARSHVPPEERRWRLGHSPRSTGAERAGEQRAAVTSQPEQSGAEEAAPEPRASRTDESGREGGPGGAGRTGMLGRLPGRGRAAGRGGQHRSRHLGRHSPPPEVPAETASGWRRDDRRGGATLTAGRGSGAERQLLPGGTVAGRGQGSCVRAGSLAFVARRSARVLWAQLRLPQGGAGRGGPVRAGTGWCAERNTTEAYLGKGSGREKRRMPSAAVAAFYCVL